MKFLAREFPSWVPRYEKLYARGAYASPKERERIAALVRKTAPKQDAALRESRRLMRGRMRAEATESAPRPAAGPASAPLQRSLF